MSGAVFLTICIIAALLSDTKGADFLHAGQVNKSKLEETLLSELADVLRPSSDNTRIPKLQGDLFQLFTIVPSESDGTLNHHVVRYVLHRHFAAKHGWFIRGLEPDGDHRDDATVESHAMSDLQEWVPSYLQQFLEQLNHGKGLSLREVAVFAATLEDLIHKEAVQRLELAWRTLGFPLDLDLYTSQVKKVMETYMIIYNQGGDFNASSPAEVEEQLRSYATSVKDWSLTQAWVRKVRSQIYPQRGGRNTLNFSQASHLVEELGERFASGVNDNDCSNLKKELLAVESPVRPGRVRLSQFYKKGLYSNWEFTEKREYLRSLGALDESDRNQPYVIVPNYVASRPNCLVCSNFYVVCCRNECEDLMTQIEAEVSNHTLQPEVVLRLVSRLSTSTVRAPRKLTDALMDRLRLVSKANGGRVPIHGRLFAQWMHHAFPRECPYPHEAGTTSPQTPDEWMESAGHESHRASEEEMMAHVESDDCKGGRSCEESNELPWTHGEELLTKRTVVRRRPWRAILRKLAVFGVLGAMITWATLSWRSLLGDGKNGCGLKTHYA